MNRKALAVLSGLLALTAQVACTSSNKATPASSEGKPDTAKVSAPVAVDAELGEDRARVTLRFAAPATNVKVDVSGVDGMKVKSATTPVDGASFVEEAVSTFDVEFTPGAGRSHLVVAVSGDFPGGRRAKVTTFSVGTPSAEQQQSKGTVITGSDGERIKVVPSSQEQQ